MKASEINVKGIGAKVTVPSSPNFIKINGTYMPLFVLTETQLREVGKVWTDNLVDRAKVQAKEKEREKENE